MKHWTFEILVYKTEHIILTPSQNMYQTVNIWKMAIKSHIFYQETGIYAKEWTFEILVYKTEHIILIPSQNKYQTVNIWNISIKRHIFYTDTGIYTKQWTYEILVYKTEHIYYINPFTEQVPNSKILKYGYKTAHIFTPTQGYKPNSEHLKSWYIELNILY